MNVLSQLRGLVADGDNNSLSSKRIVTLICTLLVIIAFFANMFFGYKIDENIINNIVYIVMTGLGFTGLEKFAKPVINKVTNVSN